MAQSNYDITLSRMPGEFLKYDQQRMIRMFACLTGATAFRARLERLSGKTQAAGSARAFSTQ